MERKSALRTIGASALGVVGLSAAADTAVAADRPTFIGLKRGVDFDTGQFEESEATRVDTDVDDLTVRARGAVRYSEKTDTTIEFVGFDDTPESVDVALFEFSRGLLAQQVFNTVSFEATFEYENRESVDDFFVDLIGDVQVD
ncbi:MAG: hypothetical protein ABEI75_03630 [Halobaculum sp.]